MIKYFSVLTLSFFSFISLSPVARAGEAEIVGAAAFKMDATNTFVEEASLAVAVGKLNVEAGANVTATTTEAFAIGTGGSIVLGSDIYPISVSEESSGSLGNPQNNEVTNQGIDINVIGGMTSGF